MSQKKTDVQLYDDLYKIIVIGDAFVGKTVLSRQICEKGFTSDYLSTIGIDYMIRTVRVDGAVIKVQIWDTAGQERFQTLTRAYYRGSAGAIFVYDITNRESFDNVRVWFKLFDHNLDRESAPHVQKILVGNKSDNSSNRKVSAYEAEKLAMEQNVRFFETSARTGRNVEEAFMCIVKAIKEHRKYSVGSRMVCHASGDGYKSYKLVDRKRPKPHRIRMCSLL